MNLQIEFKKQELRAEILEQIVYFNRKKEVREELIKTSFSNFPTLIRKAKMRIGVLKTCITFLENKYISL